MRIIGHVDMDAFFAAIEQRDNPALRGKPVIIGGLKHSPRGVVSTCSYEARKYGVHSAMPISKAVELCPHGIFLPGNMEKYRQVSEELQRIFASFTSLYEPVSIDEAYLDLTETYKKYSSLWELGRAIKDKIRGELGLTASVGIATTKSAAKIASDLEKPDGLTIVLPSDFDRIIGSLPVGKLHGVGKKTAERLEKMGIKTIIDIRKVGRKAMVSTFGKHGDWIYNLAWGIDPRLVEKEHTRKSIGRETTFPRDTADPEVVIKALDELCADVANRLQKRGLWGEAITLKLRTADFRTTTHTLTLKRPVAAKEDLSEGALLLLKKHWCRNESGHAPALRLVGVSVSDLTDVKQMNLFESHPLTKIDLLLADLNKKFGPGVVTTGNIESCEEKD